MVPDTDRGAATQTLLPICFNGTVHSDFSFDPREELSGQGLSSLGRSLRFFKSGALFLIHRAAKLEAMICF